MTKQVNLSAEHKDDWALFLPAVSSFFIAGLGRQRKGMDYFPEERIPAGLNGDVECLNFLNILRLQLVLQECVLRGNNPFLQD